MFLQSTVRKKWADLFRIDFEMLYERTSTYFEGEMEQSPTTQRWLQPRRHPDCLQVIIALVITTDGFPLAYEVMGRNTSARAILRQFPAYGENTCG